MELKLDIIKINAQPEKSLNRTYMELKLPVSYPLILFTPS